MAEDTSPLRPEESHLVGAWASSAQGIAADATALRIEALVANHLHYVATDSTGWDKLYLDLADSRLWELTYPQSDLQGGGPPALSVISAGKASRKYTSVQPSNISLQRDRVR
jgi:hypothetical protein